MKKVFDKTDDKLYGAIVYSDITINVGDVVEVVLEDDNEFDPNAVKLMRDNVQIGYLCASQKTMNGFPKNTRNNTEYRALLSSWEKKGVEVKKVSMVFRDSIQNYVAEGGREMKRFLGAMYFVPERKSKDEKKTPKYELYFSGGYASFPGKALLETAISEKESAGKKVSIPVELKEYRGRYIGIYKQKEVGEVSPISTDQNVIDKLEEWFDNHDSLTVKAVEVCTSPNETGKIVKCTVKLQEETLDDYYPIIDDAIERGCGQSKTLETKINYLRQNDIDERTIRAVFNSMNPEGLLGAPAMPRIPYKTKSRSFKRALAGMVHNKNMRFYGPASAGKNTLIDTLCWLFNKPEIKFSGSIDTDKDALVGGLRLVNGNTEVVLSNYMNGLLQGAVLVIDEANMIRAEVLSKFHSIMDETRALEVDDYGLVKVDDASQVFFTMNEGYEGTVDLNKATASRLLGIEVKPEIDLAYVFKDSGYDAEMINTTQKIVDGIMAKAKSSMNDTDVFIRGIINAFDLTDILPLNDALKMGISGSLQGPEERAEVDSIIDAYVSPEM